MQCWRRDAQLMAPPASEMTKPEVERRSDQLESARARRVCALAEWAEYVMPKFFVRSNMHLVVCTELHLGTLIYI